MPITCVYGTWNMLPSVLDGAIGAIMGTAGFCLKHF
jgi:hypothetical protein